MIKKTILAVLVVLSLLTYKFPILIPLGFVLAVFFLYKVHTILLLNKKIIDQNVEDTTKSITSLHTNQNVLKSDVKTIKQIVEQHAKKIKTIDR